MLSQTTDYFRYNHANSAFLKSRRPHKYTGFQSNRPHQPQTGAELLRSTAEEKRKNELRDKLLPLVLCVVLLFPLIALSYSGHNLYDYDITENIHNILQLNSLGEGRKKFRNEEAVYRYMERVLIPNLHPEKWYNGKLIPQPTPGKHDDPAIVSDLQTFMIGVGRVRQQRVKSSACIAQDNIALGGSFRCHAEYKKSTQDQESYDPAWDPVTGSRLPTSLTNDGWEFHGKGSRKTLSLAYTGHLGHYDGGGYILELGRTHRESESVIKYMRNHHWLDHRTRAVFIELTLMNPNINKFVDVVLLIEQSPTWAFTLRSWISPITLIPIENLQESNDLIWSALNMVIIVAILFPLFCLFLADALSTPNYSFLTSSRFWLDMVLVGLALISIGIEIARITTTEEVSDVIQRQRIDEYVSVQRAAWWYEIEGLVFSITQTIVFIKIWTLVMFTDRRFLSFALTLKLTAGFLLGFLIILSIFLFAFAFAGHFLFGQDLWEFSTLSESLITLVDQILGVSFFDEFALANPILGPVYAFLFGFMVVFIGLNFVVALLDLGVHEATEVVHQRKIWLTYSSFLFQTMKNSFPFFQKIFRREHDNFVEVPLQVPPERMQGMKDATAAYLREFLSTNRTKMNEMEIHCNKLLAGTGYRVISKQRRAQGKEMMKQQHIEEMRNATAAYIRGKLGHEMKPEEMKSYADFNKEIVKLRIQKMEKKMEELTLKVDKLVDSFT
ncbi:Polycystin-2 [Orchesella cincta]|uniref:Polycystin-2 n=1 Tax=Orchesella cincta TaxID=48709 RepID=A0A1D2N2R5_ORCCI|nr:Polycystin-2 [Orchesella cincta]